MRCAHSTLNYAIKICSAIVMMNNLNMCDVRCALCVGHYYILFSFLSILFVCWLQLFWFTLALDLFIVLTIIIILMLFETNRTRFITGENAKPLGHYYYSTEDIAPSDQTKMTKEKKKHSRKICAKTHSLGEEKKTNIKIMLVDSLKMLISMSCDINAANAEHAGSAFIHISFFSIIFFLFTFLTTFFSVFIPFKSRHSFK